MGSNGHPFNLFMLSPRSPFTGILVSILEKAWLRIQQYLCNTSKVQHFKDDPEVKEEVFGLLRDEDWDVRQEAVSYFTTSRKDDPEVKKEFSRLLCDETYLPSSNRII
jgi:hypothetical protein